MITSALLITLSSDPALAAEGRQALQARPELTLGECNLRWLPVAAEAETPRSSLDLHDWIQSVPGVEFIDVIQVNFLDTEDLARTGEVLS